MGDLALAWDGVDADLAIEGDDLAGDETPKNAVLLSLFLDRRAEDGDPLPSGDGDRRGWWADAFADVEGDRIGSRRWLLDRSARREDVPRRLERYDAEALAWFVEDRVAERVDVTASAGERELLEAIEIHRPGALPFQFSRVWDALKP